MTTKIFFLNSANPVWVLILPPFSYLILNIIFLWPTCKATDVQLSMHLSKNYPRLIYSPLFIRIFHWSFWYRLLFVFCIRLQVSFFLVTYLIQHFASIALAASGGNYRKGLKILKNKKHFSYTKKPEKFTLRRFTDAKKNASLQVRKSQKIFFLVFNYSQKTQ